MDDSHLDRLPAELRLQIYEHLFEGTSSNRPIKPNVRAPELVEPSLALTCKQLRLECLPVFYGLKKFIVDTEHDIKVAEAFLERLGPTLCSVLTIQVPYRTSFLTITSKAKYERMAMERLRKGGCAGKCANIQSVTQSRLFACASNELRAITGKLKQFGVVLHLAWLFLGSGGMGNSRYSLGVTPVMVMLRSMTETIRLPSENKLAMSQPGVREEAIRFLKMELHHRTSDTLRDWYSAPYLDEIGCENGESGAGDYDQRFGNDIDIIEDALLDYSRTGESRWV